MAVYLLPSLTGTEEQVRTGQCEGATQHPKRAVGLVFGLEWGAAIRTLDVGVEKPAALCSICRLSELGDTSLLDALYLTINGAHHDLE